MYVQSHFAEQRVAELHALMRRYPLGTLITNRAARIEANHIPFLLIVDAQAKLTAHLPRANDLVAELDGMKVLVVFHGPNAYVSPSAYPSKLEHGKVVPTWNYAVVHAYGVARLQRDKTWLRQHLEALTNSHEQTRDRPWRLDDAPTEYVDKLMTQIIGLEISIEKLEGKFKLSQNRNAADRLGTIRDLESRDPELAALARARADQ